MLRSMATFWFALCGVCLVSGMLLLAMSARRSASVGDGRMAKPRPGNQSAQATPARREEPDEPFDLFKPT